MNPSPLFSPESDRIPPQFITAKIAHIRRGANTLLVKQARECPRLVELSWWLQGQSLRVGLGQVAQQLIDAMPGRVATRAMRELGDRAWTVEEKMAVLNDMPRTYLPSEVSQHRWFLKTFRNDLQSRLAMQARRARELMGDEICGPVDDEDRLPLEQILLGVNFASIEEICRRATLDEMPGWLTRFCSEVESALGSPWYFQDLLPALVELMDASAARIAGAIPQTAISKQVEFACGYAFDSGESVKLETDGRFDERWTIENFCASNPGRWRTVRVPSDNTDSAFHSAVGEALGFETFGRTITKIERDAIESATRQSGLAFVFLDSEYLLPSRFSRFTVPSRLRWIASNMTDAGVPVVFAVNKAAFAYSASKYKQATQFPLEDWLKRRVVSLRTPTALSLEDWLALARRIAPEFGDALLKMICGRCMTGTYFAGVESVVRMSRFIAKRNGRSAPIYPDVEQAIGHVEPRDEKGRGVALAAPAPATTPAQPLPGRSTRPLMLTDESEPTKNRLTQTVETYGYYC